MLVGDRFATAIRGVGGLWPPPPPVWSYSSLRDAEECPRRWMLGRATYPSIWARSGYPPRPILPALVGEVVHRVLELILRGLGDHGCEEIAGPCGVDVLRDLGGYTKLATRVVDEQLRALEGNPRVEDQIPAIRSALLARVPDIRCRVQAVITRTIIIKTDPVVDNVSDEAAHRRRPIGDGSHPEVELRAPDLRFAGHADLLTVHRGACGITDYKTGAADPHHADQLRTYALLWSRDHDLNPESIPVEQLVISYPTHDERLEPPTKAELDALANRLVDRLNDADRELSVRPPPARPELTMCRNCSVRHLCEAYWSGPAADALSSPPARPVEFVDCEVVVSSQNGPRSWMVKFGPEQTTGLLRTPTETPGFVAGERVRLLNLAYGRDDDSGHVTLTMTRATEVYVLERRSASASSS